MARVFIGIPTLNRPALVVEAIESVRRQSFADFRVIVSDNCSGGDAADAVCKHVEGLADPRFAFHRQPENVGEYGQGRYFLREAEGHDYFMILHDDDVLMPGYLAAGIAALEARPEAVFFVADCYAMDKTGRLWPEKTDWYLRKLGRAGAREGFIDVLATHLNHGFTPITGTLFRKQALDRSGFVDADCYGNYPFEANVFLRLGEIGAKAWYCPRTLLGIRFHGNSLRNQHLLHDAHLIRTCIRIWERRRFTGALERRRKVVVSRYLRAEALIKLRQGDMAGARASLYAALRENPRSLRLLGVTPLVLMAPGLLRATMAPLPEHSNFQLRPASSSGAPGQRFQEHRR